MSTVGPGRQIRLSGNPGVTAVAFARDGSRFAVAANDGYVHLYRMNGGDATLLDRYILEPKTAILAFSADGTEIVSAGKSGRIRIYNIHSKSTLTLSVEGGPPRGVCRADGVLLLLTATGAVAVWRFGMDPKEIFLSRSMSTTAIAVSPHGRFGAIGFRNGHIELWDLNDRKLVDELQANDDTITSLQFSSDEALVSGSKDGTVIVWRVHPPSSFALHEYGTISPGLQNLSLSQEHGLFLCISPTQPLRIFRLEPLELRTWYAHTGQIVSISVDRTGQLALTASQDSFVRLWNLKTYESRLFRDHVGKAESAVFAGSEQAISGGADRVLRMWNIETGKVLRRLEGHESEVKALAVDRLQRRVISAGVDPYFLIWELARVRSEAGYVPMKLYHGHSREVYGVTFCGPGDFVVSASADNRVKLMDISKGQSKWTWNAQDEVLSVACSEDGSKVAAGINDGSVSVIDSDKGIELRRLQGIGAMPGVVFSPDGSVLYAASYDRRILAWNLASGREILSYKSKGIKYVSIALVGSEICLLGGEDGSFSVMDFSSLPR
jgi:WD40 repeat protein